MPCSDVTPAACISATMGATSVALAMARALRASQPTVRALAVRLPDLAILLVERVYSVFMAPTSSDRTPTHFLRVNYDDGFDLVRRPPSRRKGGTGPTLRGPDHPAPNNVSLRRAFISNTGLRRVHCTTAERGNGSQGLFVSGWHQHAPGAPSVRRLNSTNCWKAMQQSLLAEQLTLIRIFEEFRERGYDGGYDALRRCAKRWAKQPIVWAGGRGNQRAGGPLADRPDRSLAGNPRCSGAPKSSSPALAEPR
jgi:hypothetical protein